MLQCICINTFIHVTCYKKQKQELTGYIKQELTGYSSLLYLLLILTFTGLDAL